jgi:Flp pilus assembly protein protease CpaA
MSLPSSTVAVWLGVAFLGIAACWNWRTTKVPNALLALFLLSFFPIAWFSGMPFDEVAQRCALFGATLLAFLILFSLQMIGGGGAKLIAITVLWLPLPMGMAFSLVCAVLGAAVALVLRFSEARWLGFVADKFATLAAVLGIAFLVIAV